MPRTNVVLDPRDRLLNQGAGSLSDEEVLAVLLRNGGSGSAAMNAARDILSSANGFRGLLDTDARAIRLQGVSRVKAASILAAVELARRLAKIQVPRRTLLDHPAMVAQHLVLRYSVEVQEVLGALFLDGENRLIAEAELFRGTLSRLSVEPRPILKRALRYGASSIVLFHTHPSGDPTPSDEDLLFTERMSVAGRILGIQLVDHLILGDAKHWTSLRRTHHWHVIAGERPGGFYSGKRSKTPTS